MLLFFFSSNKVRLHLFQIIRYSSYCNQKVNLFSGKNKLYHKQTILDTENINNSNKIYNINKVAVQAKKCELLTLVIYVCFYYYYHNFSLRRLRAFWQKERDFSNRFFFFFTKMQAGQRAKHLFLK